MIAIGKAQIPKGRQQNFRELPEQDRLDVLPDAQPTALMHGRKQLF